MPPPFNIDNTSPNPSSLISAFPANEQANRGLIEEWLTFISDPVTGKLKLSAFPDGGTFPSGTRMIFNQTAAPVGWTKQTSDTITNSALRAVNGTVGSGGTSSFTVAFSASRTPAGTIGGTTQGHSLTNAELAAHTHSFSDTDTTSTTGGLSLGITTTRIAPSTASGSTILTGTIVTGTETTNTQSGAAHNHNVGFAGTTGPSGAGTAHTHALGANATFTGTPMNFDVKYTDVIIAQKD